MKSIIRWIFVVGFLFALLGVGTGIHWIASDFEELRDGITAATRVIIGCTFIMISMALLRIDDSFFDRKGAKISLVQLLKKVFPDDK